MTNCRTRADNW